MLPDHCDDLLPCTNEFGKCLRTAALPKGETAAARSRALLQNTLLLEKKQQHLAALFNNSKREWLLQHPCLKAPQNLHCRTRLTFLIGAIGGSRDGFVEFRGKTTERRAFSSLASEWLFAVPNAHLGQCLEPSIFRAALCLRLLVPFLNAPRICPAGDCLQQMDCFGYHALACGKALFGRCPRHERLADAVAMLARDAGYAPRRNAPVQCLGEGRDGNMHLYRPADILMAGDNHQSVCVDVTVVSPLNLCHVYKPSGTSPGRAATEAAREKIEKHEGNCTAAAKDFVAFAADVCGYLDQDAVELLHRFAHRIGASSGRGFKDALRVCRRKISIAIQAGVALQLVPLFCLPRAELLEVGASFLSGGG